MSAEDNLRMSLEMIDAYNRQDLDHNVTYWADRQAGLARRDYQKDVWLVAFPDTHMELVSSAAQDNIVMTEAVVTATHQGPLQMWVTKPVPASGKRIEFHLCNVGQWADGKLVDLRGYSNPAAILAQLGVTDNINWAGFR